MSISQESIPVAGSIEAAEFSAANSIAYLSAVFAAWRAGDVVLAKPGSSAISDVPGVRIIRREEFTNAPGWFEETLAPGPADQPAQISFSSGTTGQPKALLLTHGALNDVVTRINTAMEVDATIREYIGVPVTFSFGFGRARAVAAAGGRVFLPEHGFDPSEIARMLRGAEINAVSAVPSLWRVVLANPEVVGEAGRNLRWIEIGSQYMAGSEKAALRQLFPNAKIVQHYGLTEASRTTLLDITEAPEDRLESVGRAVGDVELAIGGGGVIRIRGPHLSAGRITEAGLKPIADADGWLSTSDRGRLDDGWLYYEGRTDELINCGGLKIDPTAFEQRLGAALGATRGLAVGRTPDPLRGDRVLVALEDEAELDLKTVETAALEVAAGFGLTGNGAVTLRRIAEIPRTATGKVRRAALAEMAEVTAAPAQPANSPQAPANAHEAELQVLWAEILGIENVARDQSFYDLGGDSLSALTAILRMESLGIDAEIARGIFDGKTIADLVAAGGVDGLSEDVGAPEVNPPSGLTLAEMINAVHATRGVLVLWVVTVHWLPGILTRIGYHALWIYEALTPALRFGTPGFAMIFGVGIGALRLKQYSSNRDLALRGVRFNTRLILAGVLLLAIFKMGVLISEDRLGDRLAISIMFYSALSYYLLAMLMMPVFMRVLSIGSNRLVTILATAVGAMVIHEILHAWFAGARPEGVLELIKILFTAKYGFFRMTGYVMIGVAVGWVFRQHHAAPGVARDVAAFGLIAFAFGGLTLYLTAPDNVGSSFGLTEPQHLLVYLGVLLLILAGFSALNRAGGKSGGRLVQGLNTFAVVSGVLALPIFVGHELVIPAKDILEAVGTPGPLPLLLPLGAFLAGMAYIYAKLMSLLQRPS